MNNQWVLSVTSQSGWSPSWLVPAIVSVVLGSLLLAGLLAIILVNRCAR